MSAAVSYPPLVSKGEPNLLWRQRYAVDNNLSVEHARKVQMEKVARMAEPPLATSSGQVNPTWVLWWRVRNNVSKNIAINICKAKIDGTYVEHKRQARDADRYLRKLDREEAVRSGMVPTPRHNHKPFVKIGGEVIQLDGRLGTGELTLVKLCGTKIGRKELDRIQNINSACMDAVLTAYLQYEQQ